MLGGLELGAQLREPPDAIVTALGSGGTAAGLCLAVAALRWKSRVVAVRVAPALVANAMRVRALVRGARRQLTAAHLPSPHRSGTGQLDVVNGLGRGYGHPTAAGEAARGLATRHGLALDPTYTAKAFAVLPQLAAAGYRRVVFWHTFAEPRAPAEGDA